MIRVIPTTRGISLITNTREENHTNTIALRMEMRHDLTEGQALDLMMEMGQLLEPDTPEDILGPKLLDLLALDAAGERHRAEAGDHE